jgi:ABC-type spermidine/putrescine transport system permease subunit II
MALTGVPALIPLVWLALQVEWPAVVANALPGLYTLGAASLPLLVATAMTLLCVGLPAALLTRPAVTSAQLVRAATALLFVCPGLVLALGYQAAAGAWPFASRLPTGWPVFAAALAITLPIVPLVPHLSAHLALRPSREAADLARCLGAAPGWLTWRLTLPGLVVLVASLAFFGAALSLLDAVPIALLYQFGNLPLAGAVLQQTSSDAPLTTWALTGLCLVLAASCLLASGGLLLRSRSGTKGTVHDAIRRAAA